MMVKTIFKNIFEVVITLSLLLSAACVAPDETTNTPTFPRHPASPTSISTPTQPLTPTTEITSSYPSHTPLPQPTPLPTLQIGQAITLTEIQMMDEKNGWGIERGGHAVHTRDGGNSWRDASPYENKALYFFLDAERAWAFPFGINPCEGLPGCYPYAHYMDQGVIWRTANGGLSWTAGKPFAFESIELLPIALQFVDAQTGWFLFIDRYGMSGAVYTSLMRSDDAGATWQNLGPATEFCYPTGLSFQDANTGWLSVDCRNVGAIELDSIEGFSSGKLSPSLYITQNGGTDWSMEILPAPETYPDITAIANQSQSEPQGLKCGVEQLQSNSDGAIYIKWGCSLGLYTRSDFSYGYLTLLDVQPWHSWLSNVDEFILNEFYGWRLVLSDNEQPNRIEWTASGGRTWVIYHYVTWDSAEFDFINDDIGWAIVAIGDQTALVYTEDTGDSWQELIPVVVE